MPTSDRRPQLYRAFDVAAGVAGRVEPSQLAKPTPCPEYDVAALLDHLVGAAWRTVALGRGEEPSASEFPHVEAGDAAEQLRRAGKGAEEAWSDDSRLELTIAMPWGESYSGAALVDMYLAELTAHTWDLAVATGQELPDEELAATALEGAHAVLKPEYRNAMGPGNPFGDEIEAPPGATAWQRLAAFMGRPPQGLPAA